MVVEYERWTLKLGKKKTPMKQDLRETSSGSMNLTHFSEFQSNVLYKSLQSSEYIKAWLYLFTFHKDQPYTGSNWLQKLAN